MRLCITARGIGLERLGYLEDRLRLLLGSWTCRIRQARVFFEDVNGRKNGLDMRCLIEAELIPPREVMVQGLGTDIETSLTAAARRLVSRVKHELYRMRQDGVATDRPGSRSGRLPRSGRGMRDGEPAPGEANMEIQIATHPDSVGTAARARLEGLVRSILSSCAARIPQVTVCLEDLDACRGQWGWECRMYARLLPSGARAVVGDGDDAESALRGAAETLARSLKAEDAWCSAGGRTGSTK